MRLTELRREGPQIDIEVTCFGCSFRESEFYAIQGDSGSDVYCAHPDRGHDPKGEPGEQRRYISPFNSDTPGWCPLRTSALTAAAQKILALAQDGGDGGAEGRSDG